MRNRCQALGDGGKRCRRVAVSLVAYHGDGELYSYGEPSPKWVAVNLCKEHGERLKPCEAMWREGLKLARKFAKP